MLGIQCARDNLTGIEHIPCIFGAVLITRHMVVDRIDKDGRDIVRCNFADGIDNLRCNGWAVQCPRPYLRLTGYLVFQFRIAYQAVTRCLKP